MVLVTTAVPYVSGVGGVVGVLAAPAVLAGGCVSGSGSFVSDSAALVAWVGLGL